MRIAITTEGNSLSSPVNPRFGRSAHFILYNNADDTWEVIDNVRSLDLARGAGIQAAQNVAGAGAEILLTGHCGPKAFRVLKAAGIRVVVGAEGTVAEALAAYANGELQPADMADVAEHW